MSRRGKPSITYLVYSEDDPDDRLDYKIQQVVGHLWYARMYKAQVVTGDDYTSLLVVRECDRHGIPVRTYGTNKRPRNGVNPYCRVIGGTGERDQLMIASADYCFFLGEKSKPLAEVAQRMGKEAAHYK